MSLATKSSFADNFNSRVRSYISSMIGWSSSNYPTPPDCPINIGSEYMGSSYLSYMSSSDVNGSVLTASQVINACTSLARTYTRVREFRWQRNIYGNTSANGTSTGETRISALNTNYTQSFSPTIDVTQGQLAQLPYFSTLLNEWRSKSYNRITYQYSKHDNWANHSRSRR